MAARSALWTASGCRDSHAAPETAGAAAAALRDIDFRRGDEGTGRVIVELANPQTSVDIRPQGRSLIVEFLRTSLPEGLRRRLDVARVALRHSLDYVRYSGRRLNH